MTLRDVSALDEWEKRETPSAEVVTVVRAWVDGLADRSYQAPSVPMEDFSFRPDSEVRSAVIPGSGNVEIFYRYDYALDVVDLMYVHRAPRE